MTQLSPMVFMGLDYKTKGNAVRKIMLHFLMFFLLLCNSAHTVTSWFCLPWIQHCLENQIPLRDYFRDHLDAIDAHDDIPRVIPVLRNDVAQPTPTMVSAATNSPCHENLKTIPTFDQLGNQISEQSIRVTAQPIRVTAQPYEIMVQSDAENIQRLHGSPVIYYSTQPPHMY
jgi:hypothetical protein